MEFNIKVSDAPIRKLFGGAGRSSKNAPPGFRRGAFLVIFLAIFIIAGMGAYKWNSRRQEAAQRNAEIEAGPRVAVGKVTRSPPTYNVTVIGEARPYAEVTLYAKVSGYLKSIQVDKGDVVKVNQVLAVIESPETDQDYNAVLADQRNKKRIRERMETLAKRNLVSPQEVETAQSDSEVADSKLESLQVMKGYEVLRAPFAGTVTARYADPGALVQNATTSQTSALPLVALSETNKLRIYGFLDQKDARYVKKGDPVVITLSDRPGFKLNAAVSRVSGSLDEKTRMLLTEVDVDNSNGDIVAGSFVQISLQVQRPAYLEAPTDAMVERDGKTLLPVIGADSHVHFKEVEVVDNDGRLIDIRTGVEEGDTVALNIGPLADDSKVRAVDSPAMAPAKPIPPPPVPAHPEALLPPAKDEAAPAPEDAAKAPPAPAPAPRAKGKK